MNRYNAEPTQFTRTRRHTFPPEFTPAHFFRDLTNAFSKKLENHEAAVALYAMAFNFCRVHETLRVTPAMQLGVTDHIWSIGELVDVALAATKEPTEMATDRRRRFRVIDGGHS